MTILVARTCTVESGADPSFFLSLWETCGANTVNLPPALAPLGGVDTKFKRGVRSSGIPLRICLRVKATYSHTGCSHFSAVFVFAFVANMFLFFPIQNSLAVVTSNWLSHYRHCYRAIFEILANLQNRVDDLRISDFTGTQEL